MGHDRELCDEKRDHLRHRLPSHACRCGHRQRAKARGPIWPACRPPNPDSQYRLGPDSQPQEGVPKGEIRGPFTLPSQVYAGTQHTYWVYVPAQYDPAVPAALMVFQDGQAFKDEKDCHAVLRPEMGARPVLHRSRLGRFRGIL